MAPSPVSPGGGASNVQVARLLAELLQDEELDGVITDESQHILVMLARYVDSWLCIFICTVIHIYQHALGQGLSVIGLPAPPPLCQLLSFVWRTPHVSVDMSVCFALSPLF